MSSSEVELLDRIGPHEVRTATVMVADRTLSLEVILEKGPGMTFAYVRKDVLEKALG